MPKVVTYCRVSTDDQVELSVPAQQKALQKWVESQDDVEVVGEFKDEGLSAYAPAHKRPGLRGMIAQCRRGGVDLIVVHKMDRFSRNRDEAVFLKAMLRKQGVLVRSATEDFDPDTPHGFLFEGILELLAEFYSQNLGAEVIKGMTEAVSRGFYNGGTPPLGYCIEKFKDANDRIRSRLVRGPDDEVEAVRRIFDMSVNQGLGAKTIASRLNTEGVGHPRGRRWSMSSVGHILNNQTYVGDQLWNHRDSRTGKKRDPSEWLTHEGAHEPLVDRALFEKRREQAAQRGLNVRASTRRPIKYLLGRLIHCDHCGGRFVGRRQQKTRKDGTRDDLFRYQCSGYLRQGKHVCPSLSIHRDWIEGQVIEVIRREICTPDRLAALEELARRKIEQRRELHQGDPKALERKIASIDRQIEAYFRAIAGGLDHERCKRLVHELEVKRAQAVAEGEALGRDDRFDRALEGNAKAIRAFAASFEVGFERLPFAVRREVLLHFIEEIRVVDREIVRIAVKVPLDDDPLRLLANEPDVSDDPLRGLGSPPPGFGELDHSHPTRGAT